MAHVERVEPAKYGAPQAAAETAPDRDEILNMAMQHHQAGRLDEADGLYRLLLDVEPEFADELHLFGLIRLARNQPGEAIELIGQAIDGNPGNAAHHGNLGRAPAPARILPRGDDMKGRQTRLSRYLFERRLLRTVVAADRP